MAYRGLGFRAWAIGFVGLRNGVPYILNSAWVQAFVFFSHAFGWVSELGSGFGPQAIGLLRFLLRRGVYLGCRRGLGGMQTVRECWIFLYSELFDVFSCVIGLGVFEVRALKGL